MAAAPLGDRDRGQFANQWRSRGYPIVPEATSGLWQPLQGHVAIGPRSTRRYIPDIARLYGSDVVSLRCRTLAAEQGDAAMKTIIRLGKASLTTAATFGGDVPERETMVLYNYI